MPWPARTYAVMNQVLTTMANLGPCTQRQICEGLGFTQGRVSWMVNSAVDEGLARMLEGKAPHRYEVLKGWEKALQTGEALQPPPAIDWRPLYAAFGIFPP